MSKAGKDPNEVLMGRADSITSSMIPKRRAAQAAEDAREEVPPVMTRSTVASKKEAPTKLEKITISLPASLKWEFDDIVLAMKRDAKRRGESDRISASSLIRDMIEEFVRENS